MTKALLTVALVATAGFLVFRYVDTQSLEPAMKFLVDPRLWLAGTAMFFIAFLYFFTRPLSSGPQASQRELVPLVAFAYTFVFCCFALSIAPAVLIRVISPPAYRAMVRSPVGLLKGCVHAADADKRWELACSDDAYKIQWFVNIGGAARLTKEVSDGDGIAQSKDSNSGVRRETTTERGPNDADKSAGGGSGPDERGW